MVLQVGAVRHRLPDELDDESDALRGVEQAGRTALAEMRRLLSAMRRDGDDLELVPQPGLGGVEHSRGGSRARGPPRHAPRRGRGRSPLPRAIDLSAYRIVQEGLTNALKHARANRADVTLRYAPDELRSRSATMAPGGAASNGSGYGLVGVRERVKIYGGTMTAGAAPDGGFVLDARLPLGGDGR